MITLFPDPAAPINIIGTRSCTKTSRKKNKRAVSAVETKVFYNGKIKLKYRIEKFLKYDNTLCIYHTIKYQKQNFHLKKISTFKKINKDENELVTVFQYPIQKFSLFRSKEPIFSFRFR